MRLEVHVEIGGDDVEPGDTGAGELARLLTRTAGYVLGGQLMWSGDTVELRDSNDAPVGHAALFPDWAEGERVWVTTLEGSLVEGQVATVTPMPDGFWSVVVRDRFTSTPMTPVMVDHHGRDHRGRPRLGRVR